MTSLFSFLKEPIKADSVFSESYWRQTKLVTVNVMMIIIKKKIMICQALCEHNSQNLCSLPIITYLVSTLVIFLIAVITKYPDKGNLWRVWHVHDGGGYGGYGMSITVGGSWCQERETAGDIPTVRKQMNAGHLHTVLLFSSGPWFMVWCHS